MFDLDRWREIFEAISKNKLRTLLTGFTVAFAILLFTLLFGVGNGLQNTFKQEFADDANNAIFIYTGRTTKAYKGYQAGRQIVFKDDDMDFIIDKFGDDVQYMSPRVYNYLKATYKDESGMYSVRGVYPDHQFLENTIINYGRFISKLDLERRSRVIVIGRLVEKDLFGDRSALDKTIILGDITYKVVGIFSDEGGDNEERMIYLPVTTMQGIFGRNDEVDQINITYNPSFSTKKAIAFGKEVQQSLRKKHDVDPRDGNGIRVHNMAEATQQVGQMMFGINLVILIIGLGTLIAGIVGISNIMVYVVRERTRELGIRKALGATPASIVGMIIQETIFITAIAGYSGLLLGVGLLKWMTPYVEEYFIKDPSVSKGVVIGATVLLVVSGLIAGYLPAKRAASIKPIEALNAV
jgi:putative ABC transport system permease protein